MNDKLRQQGKIYWVETVSDKIINNIKSQRKNNNNFTLSQLLTAILPEIYDLFIDEIKS